MQERFKGIAIWFEVSIAMKTHIEEYHLGFNTVWSVDS
jgi:hypothetical protein